MALDYSKSPAQGCFGAAFRFDHLVDSDDEAPAAAGEVQKGRQPVAEKAMADRFAYAEGDCTEVAKELLKACCLKAPSVKARRLKGEESSCTGGERGALGGIGGEG